MATTYLTIDEISRRLHINVGTARNRLSRGEAMPPSVRIGRRRLFPEHAFDLWMERHIELHEPQSAEIMKIRRPL